MRSLYHRSKSSMTADKLEEAKKVLGKLLSKPAPKKKAAKPAAAKKESK